MKWLLGILVAMLALLGLSGCALNVKPGEIKVCMSAGFVPEAKGKEGKIEITLADNIMTLAETAIGIWQPAKQEDPEKPPED